MYYVHYKNRFRSYVQTFAFLERASARIFVSALLPSLGENGFFKLFQCFSCWRREPDSGLFFLASFLAKSANRGKQKEYSKLAGINTVNTLSVKKPNTKTVNVRQLDFKEKFNVFVIL